ncbi:MAG: arginase [Deltaproteobacteria bacterium]|nr:arginase [Deltaproteobacteria bacterium]
MKRIIESNPHLKVIGVPLDLGASKLGVDIGPTAIRYAGILEAFKHFSLNYTDIGDLEVMKNFLIDDYPAERRPILRLQEISRVSEQLANIVHVSCREGMIPIILGGDHSTSIGSIAGVAKAYPRLGLLWIDAHPDSNTPETTLTGNIHGMTVAISLGHGYSELVQCLGFTPKLQPENICMLGIKDMDAEEAEFLKKKGVRIYTIFDIQNMGIANVMEEAVDHVTRNTDAVYVSLDADVMDAQIAPGTGISSNGGLSYREILYVTDYIGKNLHAVALDVIEVNPLLDSCNKTAQLCVELVMELLGTRFSDYEKHYLQDNLTRKESVPSKPKSQLTDTHDQMTTTGRL